HFLERGQVDLRLRCGLRIRRGLRLRGRLLRRLGCYRLVSFAISVHRSSSPSPLAAEIGRAACPSCRSSSLRFFTRSPRDSLSIFVASTARSTSSPASQAAASRPDSRDGLGLFAKV